MPAKFGTCQAKRSLSLSYQKKDGACSICPSKKDGVLTIYVHAHSSFTCPSVWEYGRGWCLFSCQDLQWLNNSRIRPLFCSILWNNSNLSALPHPKKLLVVFLKQSVSGIKEACYSRFPVGISLHVSIRPILALLEINFMVYISSHKSKLSINRPCKFPLCSMEPRKISSWVHEDEILIIWDRLHQKMLRSPKINCILSVFLWLTMSVSYTVNSMGQFTLIEMHLP